MVISRSPAGISLIRQRSVVVLPGARAAGHDDVAPRPHRRPQEGADGLVPQAPVDQLAHPVNGEVVAADRDRGPAGDGHQGMQAVAIGQPEVQLGMGVVPPSLGPADPAGGSGDQLDHLLVAFGDGRTAHLAAVAHEQPGRLRTRDVDVADLGVVQERLQASEAVEAVEHRGGERFLGELRQRRAASGQRLAGQAAQLVGDQLAGQGSLVVGRQPLAAGRLVGGMALGQRLAHSGMDPPHQGRGNLVLIPPAAQPVDDGHALTSMGSALAASLDSTARPASSAARERVERSRGERASDLEPPPSASTRAAPASSAMVASTSQSS